LGYVASIAAHFILNGAAFDIVTAH
jgi:hypothetical protein